MYSSSDQKILLCTENIYISKLSSPLELYAHFKKTPNNLMNFILFVIIMYHYKYNRSLVKYVKINALYTNILFWLPNNESNP